MNALKKQIENEKIDSLNKKAFEQIYKDLPSTEKIVEEAIQLATVNQYTRGIAWSLLNSGLIEIEKGNLKTALIKLKQSRRIFKQNQNDSRGMTCSSNSLGLAYIRLGKMEESFIYLKKSLDSSRKHHYKDLEFTCMNYIGILQFKSERYSQALRFFEKACTLGTDLNKTSILNNLGCTHRILNNNEKALEYFEKALTQSKKEQRKDAQTAILEEIGLTYGQMGDYQKGVTTLQIALSSCVHNHRHKLSLFIHLGDLFLKQQNFSSAEDALNRANSLVNDSNSINHRKLFLLLSELYERKGHDRKALYYYKKYHLLSNELKSLKLDEKFWQLESESLSTMYHRLNKISEMGKNLTASLERKGIFNTLAASLNSLFSIDFCIIGEISGDPEILKTRIFDLSSGENYLKQFDLEEPQNMMTWVSLHKSGLMLNNIHRDHNYYFSCLDHSFIPHPVSSGLCLPYTTEGGSGFIAVYSKKENAFNDEDWHFMEMLTSYATIALNNCRQTELTKAYNKELLKLNKFDNLTGIYNRRHLLHMLEKSWDGSCRCTSCFHLMLIDLDKFKAINDTWGHEAGDICLKGIGRIFKECLQRSLDGYGRYGGEEFIVYLQGILPEEAEEMAEKIRNRIEQKSISIGKEELHITASIGLYSIFPQKGEQKSIRSLIREADKNMYLSKEAGRNRVSVSVSSPSAG